jgi:hypothetical protein
MDHLDRVFVVAADDAEGGPEGPAPQLLDLVERAEAVGDECGVHRCHRARILSRPE